MEENDNLKSEFPKSSIASSQTKNQFVCIRFEWLPLMSVDGSLLGCYGVLMGASILLPQTRINSFSADVLVGITFSSIFVSDGSMGEGLRASLSVWSLFKSYNIDLYSYPINSFVCKKKMKIVIHITFFPYCTKLQWNIVQITNDTWNMLHHCGLQWNLSFSRIIPVFNTCVLSIVH